MNTIKTINGLEITDVIVFPVKHKCKQSNLLALAKVVFNDQFLITGIKILEGKNGPFIAFPQEHDRISGKNYDICFPVTRELREYMADEVISQYNISLHADNYRGYLMFEVRIKLSRTIRARHLIRIIQPIWTKSIIQDSIKALDNEERRAVTRIKVVKLG